jgi:UDP-N-acetylglucosamine acyltransferase
MSNIHPTAIVDASADIGDGVEIGPYSVVGPDVKIGDGSALLSHVVLEGRTTLGPNCHIYPFASIGHQPQDMKYHGEPSTLTIGANNMKMVQLRPAPK